MMDMASNRLFRLARIAELTLWGTWIGVSIVRWEIAWGLMSVFLAVHVVRDVVEKKMKGQKLWKGVGDETVFF